MFLDNQHQLQCTFWTERSTDLHEELMRPSYSNSTIPTKRSSGLQHYNMLILQLFHHILRQSTSLVHILDIEDKWFTRGATHHFAFTATLTIPKKGLEPSTLEQGGSSTFPSCSLTNKIEWSSHFRQRGHLIHMRCKRGHLLQIEPSLKRGWGLQHQDQVVPQPYTSHLIGMCEGTFLTCFWTIHVNTFHGD